MNPKFLALPTIVKIAIFVWIGAVLFVEAVGLIKTARHGHDTDELFKASLWSLSGLVAALALSVALKFMGI